MRADMLRYTNFFLLLSCIFLLLSSSTLAEPSYKVTCHQKNRSVDQTFQQDCRNLIQTRVRGNRGPLDGSSVWDEKISASSRPKSIWSTSSGSCVLGFTAPRALSQETWNKIKLGIEAVVNECVDHKGPGASGLQVSGRISQRALTEQEEKALLQMAVASFGITLYKLYGRDHPRLAAGVLYGSVTLLGKGFGDLVAANYHSSTTHRGAALPRTRSDELRRRSFEGVSMTNHLLPRTKTDTNPSKVTCHSQALQTDKAEFHHATGQQRLPGDAATRPLLGRSSHNRRSHHCGMKDFDKIEAPGPARLPHASTMLPHRRSHLVSPEPASSPQTPHPDPLAPQTHSPHLLRRSLCSDVFLINPSWLTYEQHQMRIACLKMMASTAAVSVGGYLGPDTKAGKGVLAGGVALGTQGAYQYGKAKAGQIAKNMMIPLLPGQWPA